MSRDLTAKADEAELMLMAAAKVGESVSMAFRFGPDYTESVAGAEAIIGELRRREVPPFRVELARSPAGVAYVLTPT